MSTSNYLGTQWHDLLLNAVSIPNVADNAGTAPLTNLYAALHTASPQVGGSQSTNEAAYASYSRVAIPRNGTGWTVSDLVATLANDIVFPEATGGTETLTHFSIGTDSSGAGEILYFGEIKDGTGAALGIGVSSGTQPKIKANSTITLS